MPAAQGRITSAAWPWPVAAATAESKDNSPTAPGKTQRETRICAAVRGARYGRHPLMNGCYPAPAS